jgi:GDP-D-mannose 3',5'-epimerase
MQKTRILVTGGAGFMGSTLVKRLVAEGAEVRVLDNLWRGRLANLTDEHGRPVIDLERQFRLADLTEYSKCLELVRDVDLVYHLADVVAGIDFVFSHELFVYRQNLAINSNVLAAVLQNRVPQYVYVGTACSFPKHLQDQPGIVALREDQTYPAAPESAYGWSKLMGEYEAELGARDGQLSVGLLRLHNVYGPGATFEPGRSQVIPALIRKAIRWPEEPFVVWGDGSQYRDFVYVDDIVDALLAVPRRGMGQGVIQIGSECPTTVRELAQMIVRISGKSIEPQFDASKPSGDRGRIACCERARAILDWRPRVTLEEGLARSYAWTERAMMDAAREPG